MAGRVQGQRILLLDAAMAGRQSVHCEAVIRATPVGGETGGDRSRRESFDIRPMPGGREESHLLWTHTVPRTRLSWSQVPDCSRFPTLHAAYKYTHSHILCLGASLGSTSTMQIQVRHASRHLLGAASMSCSYGVPLLSAPSCDIGSMSWRQVKARGSTGIRCRR